VDVNGTRFHLIQNPPDWKACIADGQPFPWDQASIDPDTGFIGLTPLLPIVAPPRLGGPLQVEKRRGAAADRFGNWYWIGNDGQSVYSLPNCKSQVQLLWPQPVAPSPHPSGTFQATSATTAGEGATFTGLAITRHNYLVVGYRSTSDASKAGLLIFDLVSGGKPALMLIPPEVPFAPFDITSGAHGGCWVLDRVNRTYWGFDRDFRALSQVPASPPAASAFHPLDNTSIEAPPATMPAGFSVAAPDPIAIEELSDGSVLILDGSATSAPVSDSTTASTVYHYRLGAQLGAPLPLSGLVDIADNSLSGATRRLLAVIAHDMAFNRDTSVLYVVDRFGRQSLGFLVTLDPSFSLELQPAYLPMHRYGGRALVAWREKGDAAISYDVIGNDTGHDSTVRWAHLQAVDRPAYASSTILETPVLDGKERDCLWDTLLLEACIPPGCSVTVMTSVDNAPDLAMAGAMSQQPDLYLRGGGSEIPFYDPFADRDPQPGVLGTFCCSRFAGGM
jgi:hypothetical protein